MKIPTYDILNRKRCAGKHTKEEIRALINGFTSGDIADYQMSAWLMAVCINGFDIEETVELTQTMIESGDVIDLSEIGGITVDKHSTGGVGDKTSLVLIPLLASAGLTVAKMSGRGLGITGGTIDKLESIPGFVTCISREQFLSQAREIGCVIACQTANLVPADKKMYALRDVTATVESIPLIASSVMSKKIASGAGTIALDVKVGSGAFMKDIDDARELAKMMIEIGNRMGRKTVAVITEMEQPLGLAVGNSLEVIEAIETLKGRGPDDLRKLCIELGAITLAAATSTNLDDARKMLTDLMENGAALRKFDEWITAQGANSIVIDDFSLFPKAQQSININADKDGYISSINAEIVGKAAGMLGAGRRKKEDEIDPSAGIVLHKKTGDFAQKDEPLATLFYNRNIDIQPITKLVKAAFTLESEQPIQKPIIREVLGF